MTGRLSAGGRGVATLRIAGAAILWSASGVSLGWYYTVTYYGRVGWPMPMPEPCAALILYYFSVLNVDTEWQAVHWVLVFPAAGLLWAYALQVAARLLGDYTPRPDHLALALAATSLPLALPGPWMAYVCGQTLDGFSWERMLAVALRRGSVSPWPWLSPMYFGLGLTGLALQGWVHRRFYGILGVRAAVHFLFSVILLVLASCVVGAVLALPLRWMFE